MDLFDLDNAIGKAPGITVQLNDVASTVSPTAPPQRETQTRATASSLRSKRAAL